MTLSAAVLAAFGLDASFLPQETLSRWGSTPDILTTAVMQIAGGLYVAFAVMNWSARGTLLGGIYGRPICLANFAHFAIGAIVLVKLVAVGHRTAAGLALTAIYSAFAVWFGSVLFGPGPSARP
jgi:hypothetical protein